MSTTLTNRDKMLLLVLAGVLIFFVVYMTVVKNYNAKCEAEQAKLTELTPQLQQLQEYEVNQKTYEAKTTKMRDEIATEMQRFPTDIRSEHIILNAKTLQDALGITVSSVGSEPAALLSPLQLPLKGADGKTTMQNVYAFTTGENISCTMSYDQFKSLLDFIYSQNERTALKSVSVTYDSESGGLSGTAAITKYFIVPENYVYEKANTEGVQQGVSNPFGTVKTTKGTSGTKGTTGTSGTTGSGSGSTVRTSGGVTEIRPPDTSNR